MGEEYDRIFRAASHKETCGFIIISCTAIPPLSEEDGPDADGLSLLEVDREHALEVRQSGFRGEGE